MYSRPWELTARVEDGRGGLSHVFVFAVLDDRKHNRRVKKHGGRLVSGTVSRVLCYVDIPAFWWCTRSRLRLQPMISA